MTAGLAIVKCKCKLCYYFRLLLHFWLTLTNKRISFPLIHSLPSSDKIAALVASIIKPEHSTQNKKLFLSFQYLPRAQDVKWPRPWSSNEFYWAAALISTNHRPQGEQTVSCSSLESCVESWDYFAMYNWSTLYWSQLWFWCRWNLLCCLSVYMRYSFPLPHISCLPFKGVPATTFRLVYRQTCLSIHSSNESTVHSFADICVTM